MKKLFAFFLILFCSAFSAAQQNVSADPNVAEVQKLNSELIKFYKDKQLDEAGKIVGKITPLLSKIAEKDLPRLASVYFNLGIVELERIKYKNAIVNFEAAAALYKKVHGEQSMKLIPILNQTAVAYFLKSEEQTAVDLMRQTLSIVEKNKGRYSLDFADQSLNVAELYSGWKKNADAEIYFLQAIAVNDKISADLPNKDKIKRSDVFRYNCFLNSTFSKDEAQAKRDELKKLRSTEKDDFDAKKNLILNGKAIKLFQPEYPAEAKRVYASGIVSVTITIDENGNVSEVGDVCGHPTLTAAASDAALKSTFTPTIINGKPAQVTGVINYNFVRR